MRFLICALILVCCLVVPVNADRYVELSNGTIADMDSRLLWTKESCFAKLNFWDAYKYCEDLVFGGSDMWRLPRTKEIQTLIDYNYRPSIYNRFCLTDGSHWTLSETNENGKTATYADYVIDPRIGERILEHRKNAHGVICVRDMPAVIEERIMSEREEAAAEMVKNSPPDSIRFFDYTESFFSYKESEVESSKKHGVTGGTVRVKGRYQDR